MDKEKTINESEIKSNEEILSTVNNSTVAGFKCGSCGADLIFDPSKQGLGCPHCGCTQEVAYNTNVSERDFVELEAEHRWSSDIKVIKCENCGASEVLRSKEIAINCPFCGSSKVIDIQELNSVKPDSMIPFNITKAQAINFCLNWIKKRFYAPKKFKKNVSIDNVNGVYYPIWTFDSATHTTYDATFGEHYYVNVTRNGKSYREQRTRWYNVNGEVSQDFDDVLISGSSRIDDKTLEKLKPFDPKKYVVYEDDLLAGYVANNYDIDPYSAFKTAEERMREDIRAQIIRKHNPDVVGTISMNVCHLKKSFKYLLIPVYVCTEAYNKKSFNQYINGINGKTIGKVPISVLKVLLTVLVSAGLIGLIVWLVITFGGDSVSALELLKYIK